MHAQAGAAVLRQAALGNVELRQDLDARDNRGRVFVVDLVDGENLPVHPDADDGFVLVALDMDVRRLRADGLRHDLVHALDDRRLGRHVAQVLDELGGFVAAVRVRLALAVAHEPVVQLLGDFAAQAQHDARLLPINQAQRVAQALAAGVGGGKVGRAVAIGVAQRQQAVGQQEAGVQPHGVGLFGREVGLAHQRHAGQLGQRLRHVYLGHQAQVHQQLAQAPAHGLLHALRAIQVGRRQLAVGQQAFAQAGFKLRQIGDDGGFGDSVHCDGHGQDCPHIAGARRDSLRKFI